jgi:imidazole glycerol-phosphate synthase subunit HisH
MIVIVDYGVGNVGSILNMLKKAGLKAVASSDPEILEGADKLILPGVGSFNAGMSKLDESGIIPLLNHLVLEKGVPILGLCLGLQLMTRSSEEGGAQGLGWIDAETIRFKFSTDNSHLKIPHMGWNTLHIRRSHFLFNDMDKDSRFYFVHSFYVRCYDPESVLAETDYGGYFHSVLAKGNIMGAQFHPEKSHKYGLHLLKNFGE